MAKFKVQASTVDGKAFDMVFVNGDGAFIAVANKRGGINPLLDSDGEYVAAPHDWRKLVENALDDDKFTGDGNEVVIVNER